MPVTGIYVELEWRECPQKSLLCFPCTELLLPTSIYGTFNILFGSLRRLMTSYEPESSSYVIVFNGRFAQKFSSIDFLTGFGNNCH